MFCFLSTGIPHGSSTSYLHQLVNYWDHSRHLIWKNIKSYSYQIVIPIYIIAIFPFPPFPFCCWEIRPKGDRHFVKYIWNILYIFSLASVGNVLIQVFLLFSFMQNLEYRTRENIQSSQAHRYVRLMNAFFFLTILKPYFGIVFRYRWPIHRSGFHISEFITANYRWVVNSPYNASVRKPDFSLASPLECAFRSSHPQ